MIKIYQKFFAFCGGENKKKFYLSIVLGSVTAFLEAFKIPAIAVMMSGLIAGNVTIRIILLSLGIMVFSIFLSSFFKYRSTMLQTEAGYYATATKRIEIAQHMRYLPMGYFNDHSLGQITSVTTNTMERVSDLATRVVMLNPGDSDEHSDHTDDALFRCAHRVHCSLRDRGVLSCEFRNAARVEADLSEKDCF